MQARKDSKPSPILGLVGGPGPVPNGSHGRREGLLRVTGERLGRRRRRLPTGAEGAWQ